MSHHRWSHPRAKDGVETGTVSYPHNLATEWCTEYVGPTILISNLNVYCSKSVLHLCHGPRSCVRCPMSKVPVSSHCHAELALALPPRLLSTREKRAPSLSLPFLCAEKIFLRFVVKWLFTYGSCPAALSEPSASWKTMGVFLLLNDNLIYFLFVSCRDCYFQRIRFWTILINL